MPGQRSKGQKMIPVWMSEEFLAQVDAAWLELGCSGRSEFIRLATLEKAEKVLKTTLPRSLAMAPPRVAVRYAQATPSASALNEAAPEGKESNLSAALKVLKAAIEKGERKNAVRAEDRKSRPR